MSDVTLTGEINGQPQTFRYQGESFALRSIPGGTEAAITRLWATRKIGYLLNQIRLNGPDQETIDQIVRLSIRYGIVTPYTSYLVTEDMPLGAAEQQRIAIEQFNQMQFHGNSPTLRPGSRIESRGARRFEHRRCACRPSPGIQSDGADCSGAHLCQPGWDVDRYSFRCPRRWKP